MQYNQVLIKSCLIFNHYLKRLGKEPKIIIFNELIHMFINKFSGYHNYFLLFLFNIKLNEWFRNYKK